MICRYCEAHNSEYDHRCVRCGRRLHVAPPAAELPTTNKLSLAVAPAPAQTKPAVSRSEVRPQPPLEPQQPALFTPARQELRVVPMSRPAARPEPATRTEASVRTQNAPRPQNQPRLFSSAPLEPVAPDSTIYCDAPVAMPIHRLMAAALDGSMVLISLGVFLAVFYAVGGKVVLNKATLPYYIGAIVATLTIYRGLWCLAGADSVGMRWSGLMLITFDGVIPDNRERWQRFAASQISAIAGGLGILWCVADEEKLTWHDHMSKTFPTPRAKVLKYPKR